MSNSGNSNRKAFAQLTCILAGTIALAGCEAAETAPPQSGPAVSAAQRVYFHAGRTLTEGDEPVLEAVLRHPSLVMMADATVKGHLWLYTNADEREQALRHHRDLLATRARDPFWPRLEPLPPPPIWYHRSSVSGPPRSIFTSTAGFRIGRSIRIRRASRSSTTRRAACTSTLARPRCGCSGIRILAVSPCGCCRHQTASHAPRTT